MAKTGFLGEFEGIADPRLAEKELEWRGTLLPSVPPFVDADECLSLYMVVNCEAEAGVFANDDDSLAVDCLLLMAFSKWGERTLLFSKEDILVV